MAPYKVTFENNTVKSVYQMDYVDSREIVKLNNNGSKRTLDSLVIYGVDKDDATQIANGIIRDYLNSFIG
jgi:hypothetical protein